MDNRQFSSDDEKTWSLKSESRMKLFLKDFWLELVFLIGVGLVTAGFIYML